MDWLTGGEPQAKPSGTAGVRQRYHISLFSPHKFIRCWPLEKLNPWLHHLDGYVEALLQRL